MNVEQHWDYRRSDQASQCGMVLLIEKSRVWLTLGKLFTHACLSLAV